MNTYPPSEAWRGGGRGTCTQVHTTLAHALRKLPLSPWAVPPGMFIYPPWIPGAANNVSFNPLNTLGKCIIFYKQGNRGQELGHSHTANCKAERPTSSMGGQAPATALGCPCLACGQFPLPGPPAPLPYCCFPDSSQHAPHVPTPRPLFQLSQLPRAPLSNSVSPDPLILLGWPKCHFLHGEPLSALTLVGSRAVP